MVPEQDLVVVRKRDLPKAQAHIAGDLSGRSPRDRL
jgi:hypothetical protein